MAGRQRCAAISGFVRFKKYAFAVNQCLRSGSGLHGSILSLAPLGCLCANFAANQSRANRCVPDCVPPLCVPAPAPRFPWKHRWKLRFYEVQKVRYLLLQPLLRALQQSAVSVSTDLSTSPEKYAFAVNRPVNRALLTIQKMPVCVDTGWIPLDTATLQYGAIPGKT